MFFRKIPTNFFYLKLNSLRLAGCDSEEWILGYQTCQSKRNEFQVNFVLVKISMGYALKELNYTFFKLGI